MNIYWNDTCHPVPPADLKVNGILFDWIDPLSAKVRIQEWKAAKELTVEREIQIHPRLKNLSAILDFSSQEHRHLTDEAWFIISGNGSMEVRAMNEKAMRFDLEPGDFLLIPSNRYHRFICSPEKQIKFLRLLPDISGWRSIYRKKREMAAV